VTLQLLVPKPQMNYQASDVSVVICTLNSASTIDDVLTTIKESFPLEIIVVDGGSSDGTVEMALTHGARVLRDSGQGLGAARRLGVEKARGSLVLNLGSDNLLDSSDFGEMILLLERGRFDGVSAQTLVVGNSYLARCMRAYKMARYFPGERSSIGTPSLLRMEKLRLENFRSQSRYSDDSDLCERWTQRFNSRFAITSATALEVSQTSFRSIRARWCMYGISDMEIYSAGCKAGWARRRRVKSLLHPLREELCRPWCGMTPRDRVECLPFLVLITTLRYVSWVCAGWKQVWGNASEVNCA